MQILSQIRISIFFCSPFSHQLDSSTGRLDKETIHTDENVLLSRVISVNKTIDSYWRSYRLLVCWLNITHSVQFNSLLILEDTLKHLPSYVQIRLWDVENRKSSGVLMGHAGSVKSLCSHPTNSGSHLDLVSCFEVYGSFFTMLILWTLNRSSCLWIKRWILCHVGLEEQVQY